MHRLFGPSSLALLSTLALTAIASTAPTPPPVLTLTPYAIAHHFTLQPFVINTPNVGGIPNGSGPLGFALRDDGKVLVTTSSGEMRIFPNHNNLQDWSTGTPVLPSRGTSNAQCIAQIYDSPERRWKYYLSQDPAGRIVEIDQDGHDVVPSHTLSLPGALCLIPYPPEIVNAAHNGHLFATRENSHSIFEIDPVANIITTLIVNAGNAIDGLTFNRNGSIIYVAATGDLVVKGFDVATHALVFTSPVTTPPSTPDGIAIGTGILTGYLYVNCNQGVVWEFGLPNTLHAGQVNLIAENGSRGDFIASDTDVWCTVYGQPSLLLTQSDSMVRLDPPGGGFFGPPTSSRWGVANRWKIQKSP